MENFKAMSDKVGIKFDKDLNRTKRQALAAVRGLTGYERMQALAAFYASLGVVGINSIRDSYWSNVEHSTAKQIAADFNNGCANNVATNIMLEEEKAVAKKYDVKTADDLDMLV